MDLGSAVGAFPNVELAFAYGSGVFQQQGYDDLARKQNANSGSKAPMVDLVFAVADPVAWHRANLERNKSHYSILGSFGAESLAAVQRTGGGRLYYNTLVPLPPEARGSPGQTMKYGVISTADLVDDLFDWRHLYVAGRMHKPVRILRCTQPRILAAARENLRHALRASLLMLPRYFSAVQLYTAVAGLSYTGDFRMVVGENPDKVNNIVAGSLPQFHSLYSPLLSASFPTVAPVLGSVKPLRADASEFELLAAGEALPVNGSVVGSGPVEHGSLPLHTLLSPAAHDPESIDVSALHYEQDTSPEARLALGMGLPYRLQKRMAGAWERQLAGPAYKVWWGRISAALGDVPPSPLATTDPNARSGQLSSTLQQMASIPQSGPSLARAVRLAERGREVMRRLRQQRLQWLVARRERMQTRKEKASQLFSAALARTKAGGTAGAPDSHAHQAMFPDTHDAPSEPTASDGAGAEASHPAAAAASASGPSFASDEVEIRNILELQQAEEGTHAHLGALTSSTAGETARASLDFQRAVSNETIVRFWGSIAERAAANISSGSAAAANAATTLAPASGDVATAAAPYLRPAVAHIVGSAARWQSLKGIATAGPVKAVAYGGAKLRKMVGGLAGRLRRRG